MEQNSPIRSPLAGAPARPRASLEDLSPRESLWWPDHRYGVDSPLVLVDVGWGEDYVLEVGEFPMVADVIAMP